MGDFKKFIDTGGKSLEEIKKAINDMVKKTVDGIVDDIVDDVTEILPRDTRKEVKRTIRESRQNRDSCDSRDTHQFPESREYTAQKIPPRTSGNSPEKMPPVNRNFNYITGTIDGEPPQLDHPNPIGYPHEAIPENMNDQDEFMLNKIREMRSLEEITHNSYVVKQCAQITLMRQGEFMADVEDDFGRRVFCALPHPIYAAMSNSQLRTYFSWRTDVRRGVYGDVEQPYIILYCYELMNRIGVCSADDAFERLVAVWKNCTVNAKYADSIIPRWIKDFYAFNRVTLPLPDEFSEAGEEYLAAKDFEEGNFVGKLDFLARNSAYDLSESIFLDEKTRPMMDGAVAAALSALAEFFKPRGVELSALVCGRLKKDFSWEPFHNAIVDPERMDGFRNVEVSSTERYTLKRGEPTLERFEFSASRGFVGYVLKSVEAQLRKLTGFKRKIIPNIKMLENDIRNREKLEAAISAPEFSEIIPKAVGAYCKRTGVAIVEKAKPKQSPKPWDEELPTGPVVVNIDVSKLDRIREQADENARKLIVDEPEYQFPEKPEEPAAPPDYEEIADKIGDDEFAESVAEYSELAPEDENPAPVIMSSAGNPNFENLDPDWQNLANNLTPDNILFLRAMLDGTEREYCHERDIMPQTIIEEINGEALLALDDVIIEGGAILEDYAEQVRELVDAFKR